MSKGGGTALSALTTYQMNTHAALLGGGINQVASVSPTGQADPASDLPQGILDYLDDALAGGNPFSAAFSYDPSTDMLTIQDSVDAFQALVSALDPETDLGSHISLAITSADGAITTTSIDADVDAFETASAPAFARSVNRLTSGMAEINAVNSSAFIIGMAQMENARTNELAAYRAKLASQNQHDRTVLVAQFAADIANMQGRQLDAQRAATDMQRAVSTNNIIAMKEFLAEELDLDYKDSTYEMELFSFANQTLAAGLGASQHAIGPSKASSQLSAAISTGGTLAALGGQLSPALGALGFLVGSTGAWLANA
jgi:hypothetical protein